MGSYGIFLHISLKRIVHHDYLSSKFRFTYLNQATVIKHQKSSFIKFHKPSSFHLLDLDLINQGRQSENDTNFQWVGVELFYLFKKLRGLRGVQNTFQVITKSSVIYHFHWYYFLNFVSKIICMNGRSMQWRKAWLYLRHTRRSPNFR